MDNPGGDDFSCSKEEDDHDTVTVDDKIKSPNIKMSVGADIVQTSA